MGVQYCTSVDTGVTKYLVRHKWVDRVSSGWPTPHHFLGHPTYLLFIPHQKLPANDKSQKATHPVSTVCPSLPRAVCSSEIIEAIVGSKNMLTYPNGFLFEAELGRLPCRSPLKQNQTVDHNRECISKGLSRHGPSSAAGRESRPSANGLTRGFLCG